MSKLTIHFQYIPDWFGEFVSRCEGNLGYIVGVDVFPNAPGVKVAGRTYLPDGESDALVEQGAAGADNWIDRFAPVYAANPHVDTWIGPNEYVLWDQDNVDKFNAFHIRFITRMSQLGHRVMCGQINTGWPRLRIFNDPPPYPDALGPMLDALLVNEGIFSLHEYGPGDMRDDIGAHCLRYRNTREEMKRWGFALPNFFISETGIDVPTTDPGSDYGHWGWRHFTDWPGYFDQLKWYSGELDKDPFILGASIFTIGGGWDSFQLDREHAMDLADFIATDEPPPPPERARGFMASKYQTTLNWDLIALQGYTYTMLRITGPNDYPSYDHIEIDPYLDEHIAGADSVGLLKGGFHFLVPDLGHQAKSFAEGVRRGTWELPLWCDVEAPGLTRDRVDQFLYYGDQRLEAMGYDPLGVYTNLYLWNKLGPWPRPLWLAQWEVNEPSIDTWEFWQWGGGSIPDNEYASLDFYAGTEEALYEKYGEETPSMSVKVFDVTGAERSWDWLVGLYGEITIQTPDTDEGYYKITEIHERHDDSTFIVTVLEEDGSPRVGKGVVFWYETAPDAPGSGWLEKGDVVDTNANGDAGFAMGPGAWYNPSVGETGPHKCWLFGDDVSEMIKGMGMLIGPDGHTNHDHVNVKFQWVEGDEPPPPPTNGDLEAVVEQLARIANAEERQATALEKMAGVLK